MPRKRDVVPEYSEKKLEGKSAFQKEFDELILEGDRVIRRVGRAREKGEVVRQRAAEELHEITRRKVQLCLRHVDWGRLFDLVGDGELDIAAIRPLLCLDLSTIREFGLTEVEPTYLLGKTMWLAAMSEDIATTSAHTALSIHGLVSTLPTDSLPDETVIVDGDGVRMDLKLLQMLEVSLLREKYKPAMNPIARSGVMKLTNLPRWFQEYLKANTTAFTAFSQRLNREIDTFLDAGPILSPKAWSGVPVEIKGLPDKIRNPEKKAPLVTSESFAEFLNEPYGDGCPVADRWPAIVRALPAVFFEGIESITFERLDFGAKSWFGAPTEGETARQIHRFNLSIFETFCHEVMESFSNYIPDDWLQRWEKNLEREGLPITPYSQMRANEEHYNRYREEVCETFGIFMVAPALLAEAMPGRYGLMRELVGTHLPLPFLPRWEEAQELALKHYWEKTTAEERLGHTHHLMSHIGKDLDESVFQTVGECQVVRIRENGVTCALRMKTPVFL